MYTNIDTYMYNSDIAVTQVDNQISEYSKMVLVISHFSHKMK